MKKKLIFWTPLAPHYLVLKPSLHGGMEGCDEWIDLADARGIGWWITSYLESNLGLNAIAPVGFFKAVLSAPGSWYGAVIYQ